jgi:hypothetical protein
LRVSFETALSQVKGKKNSQMGIHTLANMKMENLMVKGNIIGRMELFIRDNLKMV